MTWDQMISMLRTKCVPEGNLPVRGSKEGCYGLYKKNNKFLVNLKERDEVYDIAEFPTEEIAIEFIYDREKITFKIDGDTRFDKWDANPKLNPLPRAEDFGGKTLL